MFDSSMIILPVPPHDQLECLYESTDEHLRGVIYKITSFSSGPSRAAIWLLGGRYFQLL